MSGKEIASSSAADAQALALLQEVWLEAFLRTETPKRAAKYIKEAARLMEERAEAGVIVKIAPVDRMDFERLGWLRARTLFARQLREITARLEA